MNTLSLPGAFTGHFVSAPWRSSGKSMLTMGLARVARRRSLAVQPFKKGPDYIDPLWLKAASGNACYNLDPYLQTHDELHRLYQQKPNEVVLVEGTMGLHDGLSVDGTDSNGAIAKRLGLPVLLIIDCRGMHRTIAALVNGMMQFDPDIHFSGIILNRIRSDRHANKIEQAVNQYCDVSILGVINEQKELGLVERELGLQPAPDHPSANSYIDKVADIMESCCDVNTLLQNNLTRNLPSYVDTTDINYLPSELTIGIAQDEAFHFYYQDDLDTLRSRGVKLMPFSPLRDTLPSDLDGLLIGGGFPERHAAELAGNASCREDLADAIAQGLPVRAECGGLMYLCQSIEVQGKVWPMVGSIDGAVCMKKKPQGRGYMQLQFSDHRTTSGPKQSLMSAHEFHHSSITFDSEPDCLYKVLRGYGLDGQRDGVYTGNVIASYAHFRHTVSTPWIDWFLHTVQQSKHTSNRIDRYV